METGELEGCARFKGVTTPSVCTRLLNFGTTDIWGLDHSLLWGAVLCTVRYGAASLASTLQMPGAPSLTPQSHCPLAVTRDLAKCPPGGSIDPGLHTQLPQESPTQIPCLSFRPMKLALSMRATPSHAQPSPAHPELWK